MLMPMRQRRAHHRVTDFRARKIIGIVTLSEDVLAVGRVTVALSPIVFGFHYAKEEI
jgi:hypothetical protein